MSHTYKIALSFAMEDENLVEKVYHYLKAEGIHVFFAPSSEGQIYLSGKNQREAFYNIFGLETEYVALFVSKYYVIREVPMEEAAIAFAKHGDKGNVIPIYLDGTALPMEMFHPKNTNYFKSNSPAVIANHLALKVRDSGSRQGEAFLPEKERDIMNIRDNTAEKQVFIQSVRGDLTI